MNDFLIILLATTINSSFLFIIILVLDKLFYNKIRMRVIYFYTKIALLYCLLPAIAVLVILSRLCSAGIEEKTINAIDIESIYIFENFKNIGSEKTFPTNLFFVNTIFLIWLIGFIIIFIITYLFKIFKLYTLLRSCNLISDIDFINIKNKIEFEYGLCNSITKKLLLYKCSYISSPFLFGIFNPKIIIPDIAFSLDEIEIILRHELMHLKSYDLIIKFFVCLVQGLHWYNPIVIFFTKKIDDYCELSCDERVTDHLSKSQRAVYAQLLLKLTKLSTNEINTISFTNSNERFMKRRIQSIMKKDQIPKTIVSFVLLFILTIWSCPLVSIASSVSATHIDEGLIETVRANNCESEAYNPHIFEEHMIERENELTDTPLVLNPFVKGANSIDFHLVSHSEAITNSFNVSAGKGIKIIVSGDKASNSFNVGIVDTSGKRRYVESYNGSVDYTFYISEAGLYAVYFENTSKTNVHILGTIYVNY